MEMYLEWLACALVAVALFFYCGVALCEVLDKDFARQYTAENDVSVMLHGYAHAASCALKYVIFVLSIIQLLWQMAFRPDDG